MIERVFAPPRLFSRPSRPNDKCLQARSTIEVGRHNVQQRPPADGGNRSSLAWEKELEMADLA